MRLVPIHYLFFGFIISGENSQNCAFKVRIRQVKTGKMCVVFHPLAVVTMDAAYRGKCVKYPDVVKAVQLIVQSMQLAQKKKKKASAKLAVRALAAVLLPAPLLSEVHVLCSIIHNFFHVAEPFGDKCRLCEKARAEVSGPCLRGSR